MMPYLDAAFAFALTMLVVATLVTQIVRIIQNTTKLRQNELQKMLEGYFKSEFCPVMERELKRLTTTVGNDVVNKLGEAVGKYDTLSENKHAQENKLVDTSTEEMIERLKRSEFGKELLVDLGDKAQAVFDELGKRYEAIGSKFTESFRSNSKKWSTIIALVLALVINIDSIHVAKTYIQNESMRQAVITQKDAFVKEYNALARTLGQEQGKDSFTKADLDQAFKDSREQFNVVASASFPVGWSCFPYSYFQGEGGISKEFQNSNHFWGWVMWVFGILITSGLAGLGGPFWYDVVAGISRVVQRTRAAAKKTEQS